METTKYNNCCYASKNKGSSEHLNNYFLGSSKYLTYSKLQDNQDKKDIKYKDLRFIKLN